LKTGNSVGWLNMRLDISGQFVVNVVTPNGGWSKGRPIALIEDEEKWQVADLLIPNDLSDSALQTYIAHKFSGFVVPGKPIRRLDKATASGVRSGGRGHRVHGSPH